MALSDPPTDNQIMYLRREYDAILYDQDLDFPESLTEMAVRQIPTRGEISREIKNALGGVIAHPKARQYILSYFEKNGKPITLKEK